MAAVLRLATYSGPPRPFGAVLLDGVVMGGVALGVGEIAVGMGASPHLAVGLGIGSGLVGWEAVKGFAMQRMAKRK